MYTHKKFFIAAGLSGLWYGVLELVGYLGWYWLVVVLLALPCVLCFGLWMRLEDERTLGESIEPERRDCIPKVCGTCVLRHRCDSDDDSNSCDEWGGKYSWEDE